MAVPSLKDYVEPEVFNQYVIHKTNKLSMLTQCGIIQPSAELDALASSGGRLINMPYWEDLSGEDQVITYDSPVTHTRIKAGQDVATILMRENSWESPDMQGILAGSDPATAIADRVSTYWARRRQATLISILKGVFASEDMADNIYEYTIFDKTNAAQEILTAAYQLGDAQLKITGILCNSKDALMIDLQNMMSNNASYFSSFNTQDMTVGRRIIVDDTLDEGVMYLFGEGAIGLGNGKSNLVQTEVHRDPSRGAGIEVLYNRQSFILHPRGVMFTNASVAGLTPSNEELEMSTNWQRVYEPKDIRIVQMKKGAGAAAAGAG